MSDYFESDSSGSSSVGESKSDGGSTSFLLNKEVCPGMEVGDTGSFKVVKLLEKEYQCEYVSDKAEENTDSEPSMASSDQSGGGMFD